MNYKQIEIGRKLRGLKFNMAAIDVYFQKINFVELNASTIYATFYAGLVGNCIIKNEEIDFSFETVCDWVDDLFNEGKRTLIEEVCAMMAETDSYKTRLNIIKEKVDDLNEETKKKKKLSLKRNLKSTSSHLVD